MDDLIESLESEIEYLKGRNSRLLEICKRYRERRDYWRDQYESVAMKRDADLPDCLKEIFMGKI